MVYTSTVFCFSLIISTPTKIRSGLCFYRKEHNPLPHDDGITWRILQRSKSYFPRVIFLKMFAPLIRSTLRY